MLRLVAIGFVLIAGASQAAPPASGGSTAQDATERQLRDTRAQVQEQRAQAGRLKGRVTELERRSAAQRAQQAQRDREIAELQRKLGASESHARPAAAATPTPHSPAGH